MPLIQCNAKIQHTAVEYNGLALFDKSKGFLVKNIVIKICLALMRNGHMDNVAEVEACFIEGINWNIGIQVAEVLHCFCNHTLCAAGLNLGIEECVMQNHFAHGICRTDTFKIDHTGCQFTGTLGNQVAAVEDRSTFSTHPAVDTFVDLTDLLDTDLVVHMG